MPRRDEFSREDFRYLIGFLEGSAEGWLEARAKQQPGAAIEPIPDFVNHVDAALLLYGYRDGVPFEQHFDDDEYRAALGQIPDDRARSFPSAADSAIGSAAGSACRWPGADAGRTEVAMNHRTSSSPGNLALAPCSANP